MRKKTAVKPQPKDKTRDYLASNLRAWLDNASAGKPDTVAILEKKSGVSKKTIYNMLNAVYDPVELIEAVARAYGKEAWMLLCPVDSSELADFLHVYSRADDDDRKDIQFAINVIRNRIEGRRP